MTDSFISDDEEDLCPLCIEEMDISDKNFKPCPCGYQICQFCYNNIRQNPDLQPGRCPACRRIYDDESVEYKQVSTEEIRRENAKQARRERERKQREREQNSRGQLHPNADGASKKHLAGMRVIQKNLVYVIGLNPSIPTEDLHNTLRGDQFFGQYGKIQKIVINKRQNANGNTGIGVYVTFARKEDAAKCIAAVDGSLNDGKYLRAAYGTTKYCSSYLRGQQCPNPSCMFLHEPGEEADSYTRRDLSAMQHRNPPAQQPPGLPSLLAATHAQPSSPSPAPQQVVSAPLPTSSAWGKPTKKVPVVPMRTQTPVYPEKSDSRAHEPVLGSLITSLESLTSVNYVFSSDLIDSSDTSLLPCFFAFDLTDDERNAVYNEYSAEVSKIEVSRLKAHQDVSQDNIDERAYKQISQVMSPQTPHGQRSISGLSSPQTNSMPQLHHQPQQLPFHAQVPQQPAQSQDATPPPPGLVGNSSNAQNSQELLAHLMKGKQSASSQSVY